MIGALILHWLSPLAIAVPNANATAHPWRVYSVQRSYCAIAVLERVFNFRIELSRFSSGRRK